MDKFNTLTAAAKFDVCGGPSAARSPLRFIYPAVLPNGGTCNLFKVLLTNTCINDCAYCVNQIGRDIPRCAFQPEELAKLFMELRQKKLVQGLFLSSGIGKNPSQTMASMVNVVEILRRRYEFKGYIHLKVLPGASFDVIEEGCKLASRVSVNIEAPTVQHLAKLSRRKDLQHGILERMRWVKQIVSRNENLVPSGQTTQFVVGAAGESDRDILRAAEALYHEIGLRRAYFSAFTPISHSRLEDASPTPPMREHRLYQTDWLLRVYGFTHSEMELALGQNDNLALGKDPKLAIAQKQPWLFPLDVNRASYDELLRVPGIGPVSARRIVETRQESSIFSVQQLKKMRVATNRALPFLWFQGLLEHERQASFLPELGEAVNQPALSLQEALQIA